MSTVWIVAYWLFVEPILEAALLESIARLARETLYLVVSTLLAVVLMRRPLRDLIRRQETARRSHDTLRDALAAAGDGVWENNFMFARDRYSDEMFTMLGFEPVEPYDAFWLFQDRMHPADRSLWQAANAAILKPGNDRYDLRLRVRKRDGQWCHIWVRGRCIERTAHGAPARMVGTHVDVTEQSRKEEALEAAITILRSAFDGIPLAVAVVSAEWQLQLTNTLWHSFVSKLQLSGLFNRPETKTDGTAAATDTVRNIDSIRAAIRAVLAGREREVRLELSHVGGDRKVWFEVVVQALTQDSGIVGALVICLDITENRKHDEFVRARMATLEGIANSCPLAIAVIDGGHRSIRMWNPAAARIFGWLATGPQEEQAFPVASNDRAMFLEVCKRAKAGEHSGESRIQCLRSDGTRVEMAVWAATLSESAAAGREVVLFLSDVSERAIQEATWTAAKKDLDLILQHVSVVVVHLDPKKLTILRSSSSVTSVFRYAPDWLSGQDMSVLFDRSQNYAATKAAVHAATAARATTRRRYRLRDRNGDVFAANVTVVPSGARGGDDNSTALVIQQIMG